jgi:hypothetical protein
MPKVFPRIVVLFLIPCLLADPTLAVVKITTSSAALWNHSGLNIAQNSPFENESLEPVGFWMCHAINNVRLASHIRVLAAVAVLGTLVGLSIAHPHFSSIFWHNSMWFAGMSAIGYRLFSVRRFYRSAKKRLHYREEFLRAPFDATQLFGPSTNRAIAASEIALAIRPAWREVWRWTLMAFQEFLFGRVMVDPSGLNGADAARIRDYSINRLTQSNNLTPYENRILSCLEACRALNISWYGRFTLDDLEEIVRNRLQNKPDGRPLVIALYPKDDHNGVFQFNIGAEEFLRQGYRVMYYEIGSNEEMVQRILEATRDQKGNALILGGHGSRTSVTWSHRWIGGLLRLRDEKNIFKFGLHRQFSQESFAILESCETGRGGQGQNNIANKLLRLLKPSVLRVYAPEESTTLRKLVFDEKRLIAVQYFDGKTHIADNFTQTATEELPANKRFAPMPTAVTASAGVGNILWPSISASFFRLWRRIQNSFFHNALQRDVAEAA